MKYKLDKKVRVIKGRYKGETGRLRGTSYLNQHRMFAVWRDKPGIRKIIMNFHTSYLEEL